ncbi:MULTISPECIES: primosomal protein N' [unclassified Paracoccus (in: a-proteobacteria)]|uniref:primosomal protein N' n=1 Tax=unclassified Paracoccus (in: a-proteobacteria) TaxID=2688777 RepID=UPI0016042812|nr:MULTISPECIES: primosomal protein N' [unclassified Paracoccus (in: a-proteobacteria)]MBB1491146.1 primosomal protein N' [Paracoccus sp. MC1854]MBB1497039.1 primosomal protein N' [Paracoccus sp. MC1862]QQO44558.1 primosomal protein N' [Paracoccus sp. MC1862]
MTTHFPERARIGVLTTEPVGRLDYLSPEGGVLLGQLVVVPLGPRRVLGVVWGKGMGDFDAAKLRPVARLVDAAPFGEGMLEFIGRAADYTLTPLPVMLRMTLRAPDLDQPPAARRVVHRVGPPPDRMTEARAAVLRVIEEHGGAGFAPSELAQLAGVGASVVKGLVGTGTLVETEAPKDAPYPRLDPSLPGKPLAPDQAEAAEALRTGLRGGGYATTLLRGVTGSGKTEVYLEAVAETLRMGRQALVLLPEIALSAEFIDRVEARFGARPGEWHSGITRTERRRLWHMAGRGEVGVVVGARSALFLPFRDLGLIVVDEEHDGSYKQDETVHYNARDMAVLRASIEGAQVVLASATPSVETWVNAATGKYRRVDLRARYGEAELPDMAAIDLRKEDLPSGRWISPTLGRAVEERLERGEQSLLFLNRRGYAPVTTCRACGHQIGCDDCDARMVEHRFQRRLICHQCGATKPIPVACPACGVEGKLAAIGPGVERLGEEVAERFPGKRAVVLSSDLYTSARVLKETIANIAAGDADIIIGTQIVAKGHNFPQLTLVGVIDADLGLQGADLRAAERSFQLMRQVAGRAGRQAGDRPGLALLQTHQPEHPVIRAILSGDDEAFWNAEAESRHAARMPPFSRLAGIILSHPDQPVVEAYAQELARRAAPLSEIGAELFGPAPAPIARVRARYRVRMLVRAPRQAPLQSAIAAWLAVAPKAPTNLRLAVDIDPQSFL